MYELDIEILNMYLILKMQVSKSRFSKVGSQNKTDRRTQNTQIPSNILL